MAIGPRLDLRQTQSLVMTPQLQQAIKLLQLSGLELSTYVDQQLEQNPLLEREDGPGDGPGDGSEAGGESSGDAAEADGAPAADGELSSLDETMLAEVLDFGEGGFDADAYDNVYEADGAGGGSVGLETAVSGSAAKGGSFDDGVANLEETLAGQPSLREHLLSQVAIDLDRPAERMIAAHLIDLLDDAGYLSGDTDAIAAFLGCTADAVEATLAKVQRFEPAGVFARTLAECLSLQLKDRERLDEPMVRLLANLELVGRREWAALARICAVDTERLTRMIAEIRSLNPKPAMAFDYGVAQPVTPDVIVRRSADGGWMVELNSETLPRLLVNNRYYSQISSRTRSKADKQYINECLQSANWLVKSLHQRATTILKVTTEVVRHQQGFFVGGVSSLRPLVLRDIADAVSMHESTVSRVTANKFISTPRGVFELKYFFTHAVGGGQGDDAHSAAAVRHRIKGLIEAETTDKVLSDDALAERLQQEGIDIARRTVAKYRESMGIASSVMRRRQNADLR
jgi:RNA polymerase sigma-54 factor